MAEPRSLLVITLVIAACAPCLRARAQSPLLTVEASASTALTAPQRDEFGFGAAAGVGGYLRIAPWLLGGVRLRAGFLSDGDAPADVSRVDKGVGTFETLSAVLRLRPFGSEQEASNAFGLFLEGGGGGALTGKLVRPAIEAGIGYGFAVFGIGLAPAVRYTQLIQGSDPISDEDARVLSLGVELAVLDARARTVQAPAKELPPPTPQDRDADGLPDDRDACPSEPEDRDGYQDDDGCPESDNDGDKIKDADDRCPNEAEDIDEFADEDGCPDPDNDEDGFADADDQCPLEAEVVNGNKDYDGCPDEGVIEMKNDRIVLEERVLFDFERARVRSAARGVLDAIYTLYKQHPEWMKIRIEGHADSRGDEGFNQELSQRRAQNVRKELVKLGIPEAMIEAEGFGSSRPRDRREEEEAYHRNRRVEFVVVSRKQSAVSGAQPATAAPAAPAPAGPAADTAPGESAEPAAPPAGGAP